MPACSCMYILLNGVMTYNKGVQGKETPRQGKYTDLKTQGLNRNCVGHGPYNYKAMRIISHLHINFCFQQLLIRSQLVCFSSLACVCVSGC